VRPVIKIFIQALVLGLAVGICLAGGLGLLYSALHPGPGPRGPILYFYLVGGVMGFLAGWAFALQRVFDHLLALLFKTVAQLIPMTAGAMGKEWTTKIQVFFQEVLKPFPPFFQWIMTRFFVSRFKDPDRLNKALGKAQKQQHLSSFTPEWMAGVALHYFLEPLNAAFFVVYVILFILTAIFWAIPFIG
jgi:hypothetical protein